MLGFRPHAFLKARPNLGIMYLILSSLSLGAEVRGGDGGVGRRRSPPITHRHTWTAAWNKLCCFSFFFFSPEPSIKHFILVPAEREQIIPVPTRQVRLVDLNRAKTPHVLDLDIHAPGE